MAAGETITMLGKVIAVQASNRYGRKNHRGFSAQP
jgi:hypothetical protein